MTLNYIFFSVEWKSPTTFLLILLYTYLWQLPKKQCFWKCLTDIRFILLNAPTTTIFSAPKSFLLLNSVVEYCNYKILIFDLDYVLFMNHSFNKNLTKFLFSVFYLFFEITSLNLILISGIFHWKFYLLVGCTLYEWH